MRLSRSLVAFAGAIVLGLGSRGVAADFGCGAAVVHQAQAQTNSPGWSQSTPLPGRLDLRLHQRISPGIPGDDERWLGQNPGYPPWYIWPGPEFGAPVERYNYGAPYYTHPPYYGYQPGVPDYYNYSYGLPPPVPQYGPNYSYDFDLH